MTHDPEDVDLALRLAAKGWSAAEIGRSTGIARRTIADWLNGKKPRPPAPQDAVVSPPSVKEGEAYAHLLGLYLGDGHIVHMTRGVYRLSLALDETYPGIIEAAATAMRSVMPANRTRIGRPREGAVWVCAYSKKWPQFFPQHGPGPKHEREIRLADWQREITHRFPRALVRGLIQSDGCRFVARQPGHGIVYLYPRYSFSNKSRDIIAILGEHLAMIGVEWSEPRPDLVQIARRDSVEILDSFIGPKW